MSDQDDMEKVRLPCGHVRLATVLVHLSLILSALVPSRSRSSFYVFEDNPLVAGLADYDLPPA
jgi:hypothetical protein